MYALIWSLVLFVYQLEWSYLFPRLSFSLLAFLIFSIVISLVLGIYFYKIRVFTYAPIARFSLKRIGLCLRIGYAIFAVEVIAAGGVPILGYLGVGETIAYDDFGLPLLHVLVVVGFIVLCLYCFHCARSTEDSRKKKRLYQYVVLSIIPYVLMFSRGPIISCAIGIMTIYLMSCINIMRSILRICCVGCLLVLLFSLSGNLRTDTSEFEDLILEIGGATDELRDKKTATLLFWPYLYLVSPLANCEHMIMQNPNINQTWDSIKQFVLHETLPETFAKRLAPTSTRIEMDLITDSLNVSTVYARSYLYLGWWGLLYMYLYIVTYIIVEISLVPKQSPFYVTAVATLNIIVVQSVFDNMFVFMGISPILIILIIMSGKYLRRKYLRRKDVAPINRCSTIQ